MASEVPGGRSMSGRAALFYVGTLGAAILAYVLVWQAGMGLTAPAAESAIPNPQSAIARPASLAHVLLALVAVIASARLVGALFRRIHQPPVIGEVVAGILLGPSLLGHIAPGAMETLFPPAVIPPLGILAQIGVVLFMFLVGVELDTSRLRERANSAVAISHASIVFPFVLGAALSLFLYPRLSSADVSFTAFSLFLGVSMSVTAFPVLARILTDRGLQKTSLGRIALACAAADDATAWCLLAVVVGVVQAQLGSAAWTAGLTLAYLAVLFWVVRPLVRRWVESREGNGERGERQDDRGGSQYPIPNAKYPGANPKSDQHVLAVAVTGLLLSCVATERIGIHAIFGAFAFGALIPHDTRVSELLHGKLYDFVVVVMLPAFFALTGLRTQIGLVEGTQWLICGLIVLVASVGKVGGAMAAARLTGMSWRDSGAIGILMNTRGLMELIVLNVGLDLGVISPRLFAMLVIMALITTFATAPILDQILRTHEGHEGDEKRQTTDCTDEHRFSNP